MEDSGEESKPPQKRTFDRTLLDKERERLLQQQQHQQQQEQRDDVEEERSRLSEMNVESLTNSQQSLYDSGRDEQPDSDGGGGESSVGGEERSEGVLAGEGVGGEDVRGEVGGGGEEGGAEDGTCDPLTPGDCPDINDGIQKKLPTLFFMYILHEGKPIFVC